CSFFQAEGWVRTGHVTVVQTCALPIYRNRRPLSAGPRGLGANRRSLAARPIALCRQQDVSPRALDEAGPNEHGSVGRKSRAVPRSEERRVGKERRSATYT